MSIGPHLLGRRVEHDERSRQYRALTAPAPNRTVSWRHYGEVLNQADVGACTAFAFAQWRNTKPAHARGDEMMENLDAFMLYHEETVVQGGPQWPPHDPGGSGLAVCKTAQQLGLISSYTHVFGIEHAKQAIGVSPLLLGINWYDSFFEPDKRGRIEIGGGIAGGHEVLCTGFSPRRDEWRCLNSWTWQWGHKGSFYLSTATLDRLLREDGDMTVPLL